MLFGTYNMGAQCVAVFLLICVCVSELQAYPNYGNWQGNWFPEIPGTRDRNPSVDEGSLAHLHDDKHGIKMGIRDPNCDDGINNLRRDWDGSPEAYLCFSSRHTYPPNPNIVAESSCDHIPNNYWAAHVCMNSTIQYRNRIPTFGNHRPLWPRYGEYKYLPVQRWLHSLEHGAIVMLYHPCADKQQVHILKRLLKGCLYRHIITPYNKLDRERPLALVSWGCRLTMSVIDVDIVTTFIQIHALHGPEKVSNDGQYSEELLEPAGIVSTREDRNLCPNSIF